jgi:hypothetical protein
LSKSKIQIIELQKIISLHCSWLFLGLTGFDGLLLRGARDKENGKSETNVKSLKIEDTKATRNSQPLATFALRSNLQSTILLTLAGSW